MEDGIESWGAVVSRAMEMQGERGVLFKDGARDRIMERLSLGYAPEKMKIPAYKRLMLDKVEEAIAAEIIEG